MERVPTTEPWFRLATGRNSKDRQQERPWCARGFGRWDRSSYPTSSEIPRECVCLKRVNLNRQQPPIRANLNHLSFSKIGAFCPKHFTSVLLWERSHPWDGDVFRRRKLCNPFQSPCYILVFSPLLGRLGTDEFALPSTSLPALLSSPFFPVSLISWGCFLFFASPPPICLFGHSVCIPFRVLSCGTEQFPVSPTCL